MTPILLIMINFIMSDNAFNFTCIPPVCEVVYSTHKKYCINVSHQWPSVQWKRFASQWCEVPLGVIIILLDLMHTTQSSIDPQIPQCIRQISYNTQFCNRDMHISVTKWCMLTRFLWALTNKETAWHSDINQFVINTLCINKCVKCKSISQ